MKKQNENHANRIGTIFDAWTIVWGKSRREKCFACGKWTSTQSGAQEQFEPDWPINPPLGDWDYRHVLPQIAANPLWRRMLYCPACYKHKSNVGTFTRRGIPRYLESKEP